MVAIKDRMAASMMGIGQPSTHALQDVEFPVSLQAHRPDVSGILAMIQRKVRVSACACVTNLARSPAPTGAAARAFAGAPP